MLLFVFLGPLIQWLVTVIVIPLVAPIVHVKADPTSFKAQRSVYLPAVCEASHRTKPGFRAYTPKKFVKSHRATPWVRTYWRILLGEVQQ